jgi:hypothetical protein
LSLAEIAEQAGCADTAEQLFCLALSVFDDTPRQIMFCGVRALDPDVTDVPLAIAGHRQSPPFGSAPRSGH